GGGAQDARLAPASGGEGDVGAAGDPVACGDRQRVEAESLAADQGEVEGGQRGDGVGVDHAGPAARGVQDEAGQSVDGLVAGDHGAVVVGEEAGAAGPAGEVVDADQEVLGRGRPGRCSAG